MSAYDPGEHGIDLKRLYRQFIHKIWIVIAAMIIGAIIGILAYSIYSSVKGGNTTYRISNDYYITFNYDEFPNGVDYYNAYTWDHILRDDPIVEYALTLMPGVDKQSVIDHVSGEMLGDYRILTVHVTGSDEALVREISDAYKQAVPHFASEIEMLSHIDVWTDADMEIYDAYTRDGNAAFLGAFIGLVISVFAILFIYISDDGIYSERDWRKRYPDVPFFGTDESDEAKLNIDHIIGDPSGCKTISIKDLKFSVEFFDELRSLDGVIVRIRNGADKGDDIDKAVYTLQKQGVNLKGAVFSKQGKPQSEEGK